MKKQKTAPTSFFKNRKATFVWFALSMVFTVFGVRSAFRDIRVFKNENRVEAMVTDVEVRHSKATNLIFLEHAGVSYKLQPRGKNGSKDSRFISLRKGDVEWVYLDEKNSYCYLSNPLNPNLSFIPALLFIAVSGYILVKLIKGESVY